MSPLSHPIPALGTQETQASTMETSEPEQVWGDLNQPPQRPSPPTTEEAGPPQPPAAREPCSAQIKALVLQLRVQQ